MELRVQGGRAVLAGDDDAGVREVDPHTLPLGAGLAEALHEWAKVAEAVLRTDPPPDGAAGALVTRRGRQLAGRVAADMGAPVAYTDPVTGEQYVVEAPVNGAAAPEPAPDAAPAESSEPAEPTPWGTGLTVSVFCAAVVAVMVVTLSLGLGETGWWLALLANVLVVGGISPSVWLARTVPVWRWVAYGVVAGVLLAWFALLLTLL
ncbi:DUF2537 domain-containing protein [Saccharothrix australiensis]|uniref:Uncharacterized protein DUF2537 n=1 Tax=Saccharothrix australiensis TaxID=2072 RepID=A0A495VSJ5_9PSEU|nr:DUF2537 domain-containing protein [Saccharothrix australiensis]RKT52336.1 uncharacterized protein DUF2537 [Saccharothrix australiensis]